ncbi:MAG TPA: wax ester/triacylglycerol synthase family O-acyltransferase [Burkholderiaceae bacterium]|nr:wax ester/triacylglycerol synthase family O-acyltransferase [Burkholderiaceae bacterium]
MAMFSARRERVSPVDTAWLRMDTPGNLMMIVGVMVLGPGFDFERLRHVVQNRLLSFRRFRSRVVVDPAGAWWEQIEPDLDQHLVRIGLPGKGSKEELEKLVAQLASQALDHSRPLWQFHLIENYAGGTALVSRIHHCIADGIALMGVLLSMTSPDPAQDDGGAAAEAREPAKHGTAWEPWITPFTETAIKAIVRTGDLATRALKAYGRVLEDPEIAGKAAAGYAQSAAQVVKDVAALALMDNDSATSLKGRPGGSKAVAWCEPLPLTDVKAAGKALGCSVNDVLLACVAGAMREYLVGRGESLQGAELRAMVPVNLRRAGDANSLGNKFGLVPVLLPIGIEHPVERVLEVRRRMDQLKGGYTAVLAMAILGVVGLVPRVMQKQVLDLFGSKTTAVMTNVPGPQQQLFLAGAPVQQIMFWVPQSGDVAVGVSILSYNGGVQFGLVTDKVVCREPQKIIEGFAPEFERLVYAMLLAPWDERLDPAVAKHALQATETAAGIAAHMQHPPGKGNGADAPDGASAKAPGIRKRKSAFAAARSHH